VSEEFKTLDRGIFISKKSRTEFHTDSIENWQCFYYSPFVVRVCVFGKAVCNGRPVVSYGAEAWTLTKKEEQALLVFERKIFRRMYGPKYEHGEWKSRTNRELKEMSKGENIVKWIKGQRVSWLGHLEGVEEDRMPKKIFTQELEGTRRRGRPRKRWKEEVQRDLQVLGVRR
jgi:hypothetical protein